MEQIQIVKPEDKEEMKKLREQGLTYSKIAQKFNLSYNTVIYHLDEKCREKTIIRAKESWNRKTDEQKKESYKKHYLYTKNYLKNRYQNDPEFRRYYLDMVGRHNKKRNKKRRELGLCTICGLDLDDKKFRMCSKCRLKHRIRGQKCKLRNSK